MDSSVFEDPPSSDAFSPEPKVIKVKAPLKKHATTAKPKSTAPKKLTQTTLKKAASKKRSKQTSDEENSDPDRSGDDSLLLNSPPAAKKQKKSPAPKKPAGRPLEPIDNESHGNMEQEVVKPKPKKGTATETYQKLTQLEHILKRPDTYIGSIERTDQQMWVYNKESSMMESRKVSYVPGLYKIFDEILVNAADNKQRDDSMDEIKVTIDREHGVISVMNNGRGIPVEMHEKEKIYIPEMIFGHLLTGSNYDDDEQKVTGGRNGYGAKLCNIYSTEFILETADSHHKYKQTWKDNMSKMGKAQITTNTGKDYTKITFKPDFTRFGMDGMDDDFEALALRRVYDMAGTCRQVKVSLNGKRLPISNFKKYMELYTKAVQAEKPEGPTGDKVAQVIITDTPHARWEIGFAVSDGSFQQVSFVNSIATTSGGTHVNYIADQIIDNLAAVVKKKNKGGVALKSNQIKNHIFLFVNCLITNPSFTSQTKEQLTTKASQFGSKYTVSEKFLKDVSKTEAVQNIIHFAQQKADQMLKKSDGNRRTRMNNSKLTDANKAGTRDGHRCTLILTEGDSASLLALAGRAVVDPDLIGVFPLRGKLLNVRDASIDQITKNQEIQNIKKFMGLQHKKHYDDTRSLRYGHLMIMTDQDHDGSHIKGLLINFLECSFPSLLKIDGFLQEFITPIVKVWKGDPKKPKNARAFFTMPEYEAWKEVPGNQRGWDHKYYKGLGTSAPADAEVYFRDLDRHLKEFDTMKPDESLQIELAFSKKKADDRKEWLRKFVPGTFLSMDSPKISYDDFVNKELILFSMADNLRSIPSVIDGLKPGQRKVLYTCFRRNLKKDVKVVELAGSVSGLTAYAYGETSLQQTIVGLAQNFVGSNNINCLEPSGNFGSRLQGGSDSASARYIYTRLSPFARKIFSPSDEPLLEYNMDDGKTIEPVCYSPILPMILVNGADGIGTGWSTSIPNYNPVDIIDNLRARMQSDSKDAMQNMKPWFRGWTNEVEDLGGDRWKFSGTIEQTDDDEVRVTELPVRMWTQDFKDRLEEIIKAEKVPSFIKDYTEYNTPVKVDFVIKIDGDKQMKLAMERGLEETFKLSKTMATSNVVAFDSQGRIHKYASVLDILEEFYHHRLKMYGSRKAYLLKEMQMDLDKLNNQARFVEMIVSGKLVINKKKKAALVAELRAKDFKPIPKTVDAKKQGEFEPIVEEQETEEEAAEAVMTGNNDFDYLLGMAIWSLTQERIDKLRKQVGDKESEFAKLTATSDKQLWIADLDAFVEEWTTSLAEEAKTAKDLSRLGRRASTKLRIGAKGGKIAGKKRKVDSDEDSDGEFATAGPVKKSQKAADIFDFGIGKADKKPPKSTVSKGQQGLLSASIGQQAVAAAPAVERGLIEADFEEVAAPAKSVPTRRPGMPKIEDDSGEDLEDSLGWGEKQKARDEELRAKREPKRTGTTSQAPPPRLAPPPPAAMSKASRAPRAATNKTTQYHDSDDDDDEDDFFDIDDIGDKLKSFGAANTGPSKSLYKEPASGSRPSSSHSVSKPRQTTKSESDGDTNYAGLVAGSPVKATQRAHGIGAASDDDDALLSDIPVSKPKAAISSKATTKPTNKLVEKAKKEPTKHSVVAPPAAKPLSPAAKAYAKRHPSAAAKSLPQPKLFGMPASKVAPPKKRKADESDEDEDDIANELLSDDEDDAPAPSRTEVRPSRRAAATKAKYVVDDEDDSLMKDESAGEADEPSFEEDDDD